MHYSVHQEQEQRQVSWRVGALLVLTAAVVASLLTWLVLTLADRDDRPAAADVRQPGEITLGGPEAGTAASSCTEAVALAEQALVQAREIDRSLATQTQVVNELVAGRATADQVLARALPSLTRGAQRSTAFSLADQEFRAAAGRCR